MTNNTRTAKWTGFVLIYVAVSACSPPPTSDRSAGVASEREPLVVSRFDMTDWSGRVHVRVKRCDFRDEGRFRSHWARCSIDGGYVLVGGGVTAVYEGAGALLLDSAPMKGATPVHWMGITSDHGEPGDAHQIEVYSVGLRLDGVDSETMAGALFYGMTTSSPAQHPSVTTFLPEGYVLLGGGAHVGPDAGTSGDGQFLKHSFPSSANS